ncbi:endopeptidase [Weissella phage PWc]|nr:endopeptidase [Weissella phage PWc]
MNLFIFDIKMKNIGYIRPEIVVDASVDVIINEAFTMTLTIPTKDDLPDNMRFIATPHPKYENEYMVGQMARKQVDGDLVTYTFREYFYQQLDKGVISIEKPNFNNRPVADVLNYVLKKKAINWKLVEVMNKNISIYLYYDSGLEVFQRVQEILGGEYVFTCEIDPKSNDLINHKVRYVESQGKKTGRRFERDTNLLSLKGEYDFNNIFTLIYPRGKGVEVDNPEAPKNAPVGYGRRLTIESVNPPDPSDPLFNGQYIWDKEATKVWGSMYATRREKVVIYEDITDAKQLYDAGKRTLNEYNHPSAVYTASVTDIDYLDLGDEVYIIWRDEDNKHKFEYSTRVFGYHYDLVNPANNTLTLGDQRKDGNLGSTLSGMSRRIENAQNVATWAGQTVIGTDAGYGDKLPTLETKPREGDVFYLKVGNGLTDMYIFIGGQWVKKASSDATDFANQGKLNGDGKTFYGEVDPISPVDGDTWFKYKGDNASSAVMYIYKDGEWVKYGGVKDANGLVIGSIDAKKINVININASNITAGKLSADIIEGGTIDASKINVVNINANQINSGELNTANISVVNTESGTEMTLSDTITISRGGKTLASMGEQVIVFKDTKEHIVGGLVNRSPHGGDPDILLGHGTVGGKIKGKVSIGNTAYAATYADFSNDNIDLYSNVNIHRRFMSPAGATSGIRVTTVSWSDLRNEKMITLASAYSDLKARSGIAFSDTAKVYAWDGKGNTRKEISNW